MNTVYDGYCDNMHVTGDLLVVFRRKLILISLCRKTKKLYRRLLQYCTRIPGSLRNQMLDDAMAPHSSSSHLYFEKNGILFDASSQYARCSLLTTTLLLIAEHHVINLRTLRRGFYFWKDGVTRFMDIRPPPHDPLVFFGEQICIDGDPYQILEDSALERPYLYSNDGMRHYYWEFTPKQTIVYKMEGR